MVAPRLSQLLVCAVSLVSVQASLANRSLFFKRADGSDSVLSDVVASASVTVPDLVSVSSVESVPVSTTDAVSSDSSSAAPSETIVPTTLTSQEAAATSTNRVISTTAIPTTSIIVASTSAADVPPPTTAAPSTDEAATPSSADGPDATTSEDNNDGSSTTTSADDQSITEAPESSDEPTRIITTQVTVITRTNSDGSRSVMTTSMVTTSVPGLNTDDGQGENTGMSAHTRNTIIGVVVGVGGAIILGALALVAWRIWGRKKHTDEDDAFISYGPNEGYTGIEKSEPSSSASNPQRSPFQSTLENYHQPSSTSPVNASANF